jgi:thioredoxin reductase
MEVQDCIIVGGGPAGLNAAVVLGRSRRKVLVFDTGTHRNRYSHGMHNYLTRDDIMPLDFLNLCRREIKKYKVQLKKKRVINARKNPDGLFVVKDANDGLYYSKKLLIATGLKDNIPDLTGIKEMYGISVFHCPYCDGWEVRDKKLGVYARNKNGAELALALKTWSRDVTLFTDGKNKIKPEQLEQLEKNDVEVIRERIDRLEGNAGYLKQIVFKTGDTRKCEALFFVNGFEQQCNLFETFGVNRTSKGIALTNRYQQTNIDGLYVAGDASRDMHFVVVAAAEGAKAGVIINKELQKQEWEAKTHMKTMAKRNF